MIGAAANDRDNGAEEARLFKAVHADVTLGRAAFAGVPFHINDEKRKLGQARSIFSEAVVLSMIDAGLLYATQQTEPWPMRGVPARPFSVRLTTEGEEERVRLLRGLRSAA
ncbi:MAG: hypothetical protein ACRED4_00690 [Brevundimonas sp.]